MTEPDNPMVVSMRIRIAEIVLEQEDENEDLIPIYDPVIPIAPIILAHLKFFMSTVIQRMAMQKKKCLLSTCTKSTLMKKENDPKNACSGLTSKVVYENPLLTAEDFFHVLRDDRRLIPSKPIYNLLMGRLLSHFSLKRSLKKKRALKQKEEDDEETS